jgi:K(+)-stimulated pyrophosphate-energized sodium pump
MTELLLVVAIGVLGVVFATTVARWVTGQPAGDEDLVRAADVVSGGVVRYLRRHNILAGAVVGVVGALVFLVYGLAYQTDTVTVVSPREHGVWVTIAYLFGAGFGVVSASVSAWAARHASARVAAGVRRSLDDSLQIAVRAGAVSGVIALALSLIGLAGLFLAYYVYAGGLSDPGKGLLWVPRIPFLLPGFALGSAFVALLAQLGGGIFGKVADIGADIAGKLEGSLPDAQNPAAVADLVGDHVGDGAARVTGVFAAAVVDSVAAMLIAAEVYRDNENLPSVTALVLFPLVARTFSLLGAWFGVMVVRTDDTEVPMNAVARGLHVTTLLYAVGAIGCAKWLLGEHWLLFGSCAVVGSAVALGCLYATQYYSEQKYRPVRMLAEAARGGPTLVTLRGMFTAAEGTFVQTVLVVGGALGAFVLGARSGLEGGGLLGVAVAVGGMLGSAPYVLAMDSMGSIADTAGGIIEMTVAAERPDVRARARLLDAMGTTAKSYTRTLITVTSGLSCFLLISVFLSEVWESSPGSHTEGSIDVTSPALYVGGVLGGLSVLLFMWLTLRRIVLAARELINELRVQLGAERAHITATLPRSMGLPSEAPADPGVRGVPGELGEPDERASGARQLACVEIVSRVALRGMLTPAFVGIGFPLLIGVALRLLQTGDRVASSAEALVALLLVATIAGALGSLLFTTAGSAWDNAKKYIETGAHGGRYLPDPAVPKGASPKGASPQEAGPRRSNGDTLERAKELDNPASVAAVIGDTVGDPLKGAVGPATQALLITLVALALVFLPFFL